jgi:hypothetical protein
MRRQSVQPLDHKLSPNIIYWLLSAGAARS